MSLPMPPTRQTTTTTSTSTNSALAEVKYPPRGKNKRPNLGWRHDFLFAAGEFLGTAVFLFLALGGTNFALGYDAASPASRYFYVAVAQGIALITVGILFVKISGSVFNPAISFTCLLNRSLHIRLCAMEILAQILGAIAAAYLLAAVLPSPIVANTALARDTTVPQGLFLEATLTTVLCFTVLMLPLHIPDTSIIGPVIIGLTLLSIELFAAPFSGAGVNPARALSAMLVARTFHGYDWIYYVGPFLGSIFGMALFQLVQLVEYRIEKEKFEEVKRRRLNELVAGRGNWNMEV